jgi:hypothetical protein
MNNSVTTVFGTIAYDTATGTFRGRVPLGTDFTSGQYQILFKIPFYLGGIFPGFPSVTTGQERIITQALDVISGDADDDNKRTILDYNLIISCYSFPGFPSSCNDADRIATDVNDDDNNDESDQNLFIRELQVSSGN